MTKYLFAVLILCASCFVARAQFPQFHFENITTAQGLSSNEITCIYQDHEGFLWIGTHFGLNRYDGNVVQTFYHNDATVNSLSGNDIVDILEDEQNIFWIATKDGGLTRYDPSQMKNKQFHQFKNNPADKNSIATNRLNCLYDYNKDYLLIGAEVVTGIFLNKKTMSFTYMRSWFRNDVYLDPEHASLLPTIPSNWIHHIVERDSTLYISFLVGGYVYAVKKKGGYIDLNAFQGIGTPPLSIPSFVMDGDKAWLASWGKGLYVQYGARVDSFNFPVQKKILDINDQILCVCPWNKNFMLAGSKSSGLYIINRQNFSSYNLRHDRRDAFGIASNKINCIFKDKNGILWIGTSNGISKYNPDQWQFQGQQLSVNDDRELTHFTTDESADGTLRVCTSDGIYKKKKGEKDFHFYSFTDAGKQLSPTFILHVADRDFLCTENSIYNYQPSSETIENLPLDSNAAWNLKLFHITTMQMRSALYDTISGHPFIIIGILGDGVGFYDLADHMLNSLFVNSSIPTSIRSNLVKLMVNDRRGDIWIGTSDGLYRWNKGYPVKNNFTSFLNFPGNDSTISGNNISGVYADEQNHLWVTTMGNGLNEFDGKFFRHYKTQTSAGNNMLGIYADHNHRYWIPTSQGFEVFDVTKKKFEEVTIPNPEWILKYPTRILVQKDGAFSYGAGNYFVTFHPDSFHFENATPKIYLTDFKVMDKSIMQSSLFANLRFPYDKNFFSIDVSSLQLSQPSSIAYQYRLVGLSDQWSESVSTGNVSYTSLPPGSYSFEVKVTNAVGVWSAPSQLISFTVERPFWMRWWFYVLSVVAIAGIIYLVMNFRVNHLLKIQSIRNRIANDLHDDVGSALSTISIYSEVAKMKSGDEQNDLKDVLEKISSTSQEMQENMSYIVWSIQPRNDRFDQMVQRMKRYAIDMLQPNNIKVNFIFDDQLNSIKLPQEKRKELFLIFKEAIHNITKYAQCEVVNIVFKRKQNKIFMEINDDGIGFRKEEVISGNGFYTMQERARTLKGELKISSQPESGTTVTFIFTT